MIPIVEILRALLLLQYHAPSFEINELNPVAIHRVLKKNWTQSILTGISGFFGDSPKILWYPPKFWAVPFPNVFLKLLQCLAPSPSPNFGGFWGFSPENPRYMDCPHPRSFPRAFKRCIPVPTPSPQGRGIHGDYRGLIPESPL